MSNLASSSSGLRTDAPAFIPRATREPPKPPQLSQQLFDHTDRTGGTFTASVLLPKCFVKEKGGDIDSVRSNSSLHGLCGNGVFAFFIGDTLITTGAKGKFDNKDFDSNFNVEGNGEIFFQLLTHWRNNQPLEKTTTTTLKAHNEWFWSNEYLHTGEVFMNQEEYFTYSLEVFSFIAEILDPALKNCSGHYLQDGRRILLVQKFINELISGGLSEPTIHTRKFEVKRLVGLGQEILQPEQEILELKFFIRASNGEFIDPTMDRRSDHYTHLPVYLV